jgi:hypothetical protein
MTVDETCLYDIENKWHLLEYKHSNLWQPKLEVQAMAM